MYSLYEHLKDGNQLCLGVYDTIPACNRATEIRWNIMEQLGYAGATFHCEKVGSNIAVAKWHYNVGV